MYIRKRNNKVKPAYGLTIKVVVPPEKKSMVHKIGFSTILFKIKYRVITL